MQNAILTAAALLAGGAQAQPAFQSRDISTSSTTAVDVTNADLDADGDLDVIVVASGSDSVEWFENDGQSPPGFTPRTVTSADPFVEFVDAQDMDADGDIDVLTSSQFGGTFRWYENDGQTPPAFAQHDLATGVGIPSQIIAVDLDKDGDMDALGAGLGEDVLYFFDSDGQMPPVFTVRTIPAAGRPNAIAAADLDADGDNDIAVLSVFDNAARWYRNNGGSPPTFTPISLGLIPSGQSVEAADLEPDGDIDLVIASQGDETVRWLQNNGATTPFFLAFPIDTNAINANDVALADLDADGDIDIVGASLGDDLVKWYENSGDPTPSWTTRLVSSANDGPVAVSIGDLDADRDLDLMSASFSDNALRWYESNLSLPLTVSPAIAFADPGDPLVFGIEGLGEGSTTFRWRLNGVDLTDAGGVTGSATDTLQVVAGASSEGVLDCVITDALGDRTTRPAALGVFGGAGCAADVNGDGLASPADFTAWLAAFQIGCP